MTKPTNDEIEAAAQAAHEWNNDGLWGAFDDGAKWAIARMEEHYSITTMCLPASTRSIFDIKLTPAQKEAIRWPDKHEAFFIFANSIGTWFNEHVSDDEKKDVLLDGIKHALKDLIDE